MSKAYPIWNKVTNCTYQGDKSYGNKETGEVNIYVGSSAKNSEHFVRTLVTKRDGTWKGKQVVVFKFSVDDVVLKYMIFEMKKDGTAGKLLKKTTKLKSIKSLKL